MKFTKIHLINFQKHSNLILDLNPNLNIITGLTDTGKSAIFRAIEWLCNFSNVSEVDYRKEGTKETSVKAWTDNGFQIQRIRSNTLNRYILNKEGCEEKVFDSFGRETPEEIQKVLGIQSIDIEKEHLNLNFANQDQLNFILDSYYSDTFKAKLFNKLTGNELLDDLFKDCNRDSLRINREIKETTEQLEKQEEELAEYIKKYKELNKKYNLVKDKFQAIKEEVEIYENLKELAENLKTNKKQQQGLKEKVSQIKTVSEEKINKLKTQAEELKRLQDIFSELKAIDLSIEKLNKKKVDIKIIDVNFDKLTKKLTILDNLKQLNDHLDANTEAQQTLSLDNKAILEILKTNEKKLKKLWEECDVCPLCKTKVKK
ncbi:MAG: AAA family ATPase [Candidatus Thorarchaeota archaeon]|jgi:exonuclease SbcC